MIKFLKNMVIYKKLINYVCEILGLNQQFFRKRSLLKLNYKVEISKRTTTLSKNFYKRIINFLNQSDDIPDSSLWSVIYNTYHKKFLDTAKNDIAKLENILDNPSKYNIFYGFDNNCEVLLNKPRYIDHFENNIFVIDKILNLAEFLGILRHNNPEQFRLKFKKPDLDFIIEEIEKKLCIELKFDCVFPGEEGIKTKKGIISNREIQAIYQAYKIKKIFDKNNYNNILEIGGGLGRTAYYCNKFGIKNYTIVDLLIPRICQLNYLSRVINERDIISEKEIIKFINYENKIKIISPNYLFNNEISFDLVFNSDSLTEIDDENQKKYVNLIKDSTKYFYSINHESNKNKVTDLFSNIKTKYHDKNLYWMRKGYLEEHFIF